jgi:hypothetical protein
MIAKVKRIGVQAAILNPSTLSLHHHTLLEKNAFYLVAIYCCCLLLLEWNRNKRRVRLTRVLAILS